MPHFKCYLKTRNSAVIKTELKNISKVTKWLIPLLLPKVTNNQSMQELLRCSFNQTKKMLQHLTKYLITLSTYFWVYHKKQVSDKDFKQLNDFWLPNREGSVSFPSIHLSLRNRVPTKIQLPVESTIGHVRTCHIFKGVITDYINDGTNYCPPRKRKEAKLLNFKLIKLISQKSKEDAWVFFFLIIVFTHTVDIFIIPSLNNIIQ